MEQRVERANIPVRTETRAANKNNPLLKKIHHIPNDTFEVVNICLLIKPQFIIQGQVGDVIQHGCDQITCQEINNKMIWESATEDMLCHTDKSKKVAKLPKAGQFDA